MNSLQDISEENLNMREFENGNSSALFKKRKVSATRVFPPGCGRNACMYVVPHVEKKEIVSDKKPMIVSMTDCLKAFDVRNALVLHESVTTIPGMGSLLDIHNESLNERLLEKSDLFKKRKVSATRVFPPGCGPNAPRIYALPHVDKKEKMSSEKPMNVSVSDSLKASEVGKALVLHKSVTIPMMGFLVDARKESMNERLLENRALFKKREVSATRVFPPGCGRNAPCMYAIPYFDIERTIADKKDVNVALSDCSESSDDGNALMLNQLVRVPLKWESNDSTGTSGGKVFSENVMKNDYALEKETLLNTAKRWIPSQCPISTLDTKKDSSLKTDPKIRVSAIRKYPPFCGRNAPCPTKEERFNVITGNYKSCKKREKRRTRKS